MKVQGKTMSMWLKEIELDQNLRGIDSLPLTVKNEQGRLWYLSQVLNPELDQGHYDPNDGRYHNGPYVPHTATNYTSAVNNTTQTLTCPASRAYKVTAVGLMNNTTAPQFTSVYTPLGGTASTLTSMGGAGTATNSMNFCIGGVARGGPLTETAGEILNGPLWMRPGDTLAVTQTNPVAGDTISILFVYEEYVI